jgi:hypothetical protein
MQDVLRRRAESRGRAALLVEPPIVLEVGDFDRVGAEIIRLGRRQVFAGKPDDGAMDRLGVAANRGRTAPRVAMMPSIFRIRRLPLRWTAGRVAFARRAERRPDRSSHRSHRRYSKSCDSKGTARERRRLARRFPSGISGAFAAGDALAVRHDGQAAVRPAAPEFHPLGQRTENAAPHTIAGSRNSRYPPMKQTLQSKVAIRTTVSADSSRRIPPQAASAARYSGSPGHLH